MIKAFSYLWVSGKGQVDGGGFTRQRAAIQSYAQTNGIEIIREFREEGIAGTAESTDRPSWAELMAALHCNGVRTVIVERLDRLARHLRVQETALADARTNGYDLVSAIDSGFSGSHDV